MKIASLELELFANVARLAKDMESAEKVVNSAVGKINNTLNALGIGISAGAFVSMIKGSIDAADKLGDLSKTTKIAVEDLAGLQLAADQSGSDLDSLASTINKLATNMGKDADKFRALGISAQDPIEAFGQLSDLFRSIEDPQTRAALGADTLGKKWEGAAPLLEEGSAKIAEMVKRGRELSGVSLDMVEKSDEFNDKLGELNVAFGRVKNGLASELLPLLTILAETFTENTTKGAEAGAKFSLVAEIFKVLMVVGSDLIFVFKTVVKEFAVMAAQVAAFLSGNFKEAAKIGEIWTKEAAEARAELDAWQKKVMEAGTTVETTMKESAKSLEDVIGVTALLNRVTGVFNDSLIKSGKLLEKQRNDAEAREKTQQSFVAALEKEVSLLGLSESETKRYEAAQLGLNAKQMAAVELLLEKKEAFEKLKQAQEEDKKLAEQVANSQRGAVVASNEALAAAQREYEQYGMSKSQIAEIVLLKLQEDAANKQAGSSAQISLQAQIENQKQIIEFLRSGELRDANKKAADDAAREHARAYDQISQSLTDAIMRGGKNAGELLRDYFKTLILRPIVQAIVNPIAGSITELLGMGNAGGAAGSAGSLSGIGSILSSASGLLKLPFLGNFANGFSGQMLGASAGMGPTVAGSASGIGSMVGSGAGSAGASIASAMPAISAIVASYFGAKAIAGGYKISGIGNALNFLGLGGGLLNRAFGMGPKEFGPTTLNGSFGPGGFSGTRDTTWTQKGGWFRSDKSGVDKAPVDPAMVAAFTKGYEDLKKASTDFATVLGLNADSIQSRVQSMSIALSQNEAENEKAIAEFFAGVRDSMAVELLPAIIALQQEGESAGDTLQRLAINYVALDGILSNIGMSFGAVGESSLVARERLIAASGGLDVLAQNTAGFYQNFYTEAERLVPVQAQVTAEMSRLGLAHVDTAEEFRDAVTSLQTGGQLATEEGANLFASLMKIQGAFAAVYPLIDSAAEALRQQLDLQAQIDRLTMSENDLRARQFDLTNDQTKALWDQLMALEAANEAAAKAKEAADALNSVNDGWLAKIKEFDDSLLTETQRRENEIAAMEESTAALAKLYYARLDAKALDEKMAADELAAKQALLDRFAAHNGAMYQSAQVASEQIIRASEEALAAQKALADLAVQKAQLEERAFMATATEAERLAFTRQKELDAIDPTLEALLRHAHAMEDQASAAVRSAQVLAEGRSIERDMAQLMGDTGKLRELELATIAVENHAAKKAYWAQQDKMAAEQAAAQAAAEMARAMAQAAEAQQRAAEQMKSAWQSVTDGIFDQVRKIRGSMAGNSATSLSQAQADFAVATARARAGDQEAAKSLSGLSDSLLDQALRNARSQQEYRAVQAAVAASLVATGRGFAGQFGLNTPINAGSGAASEEALSSAIANLNREFASVRSVLNSINSNTRRNADVTEQVTNGGEAMIVAS